MEAFLVYVIICLGPSMSCKDMMIGSSIVFRSYKNCKIFADKSLEAYKEEAKRRHIIFVDGIAFCLRFKKGTEI